MKNIFKNLPDELDKEYFEQILLTKNFKMERIISEGHSSPKDFWYDQNENEFVLLMEGNAKLSFDDGRNFELNPGDYLIIPAHQKHRVDWTDPAQKTFWLTIHY